MIVQHKTNMKEVKIWCCATLGVISARQIEVLEANIRGGVLEDVLGLEDVLEDTF